MREAAMIVLAEKFPRYWRDETSGVLQPAVFAYLNGDPMSAEQVAAMRAYLRQWIDAPVWAGPAVADLRHAIDHLVDREDIGRWLAIAEDNGIDPL